jgi:thermostable 8-oxoguanine DNA glycosylase
MEQRRKLPFKLQFDPIWIPELLERYNDSKEADALEAGKRIGSGEYSRSNLANIVVWRARRGLTHRISNNKSEEISDALRLAVAAQTDRIAIAVLRGLRGVDVQLASAILTAIKPERFIVMDFRILEALGATNINIDPDAYLDCLEKCRDIATENGLALRQLDRALWQWSWEREQRKRKQKRRSQ